MSCTRNQPRSSRGRIIKKAKCDCGCESDPKTNNNLNFSHNCSKGKTSRPKSVKKAGQTSLLKNVNRVSKKTQATQSEEKKKQKTLYVLVERLTKESCGKKNEEKDNESLDKAPKVQRRSRKGAANVNVSPDNSKTVKGAFNKTKTTNDCVGEKEKGKTTCVPFESSTPIKKLGARKNVKVTTEQPNKLNTRNKHVERESLSKAFNKLRSRKGVKYTESSLEESNCGNTPNVKKIPIYRQQLNEKKRKKRDKDDYEFDSDTEDDRKQKKKRNDSDIDDASLENFLNKAVKKKHKNAATVKKPTRKKNAKKAHIIIDEVFFNPETRKFVNTVKKSVISKEAEKKTIIPPKPVILPSKENEVKNSILEFRSSDESTTTINYKSPKVRILSDVHLTPRDELYLNVASPTSFRNTQPNANSTMINNKVLTPWRFNDINIRRNPHFITLKQSSLPCINQEMVLDHTIVDRLNETSKSFKENSLAPVDKSSINKQLVQVTLNDYLDSNKENEENHNISLFDYDQFSPVKNRSKVYNVLGTPKRKVLGEKNENQVVSSTLEEPVFINAKSPKSPKKNTENDIDLNFGFDTDEEEVEGEKPKSESRKPFRVSMNLNDKKYQPKRKVRFQKKAESVVNSDEESSESDVDDLNSENGQFRLFEDFDTTNECLQIKQRKRKFEGDHRDLQKPKKRKDVRTKEEEEEAEKWAAAFNSMCAEVEEFPLEIE